MSKKGPKRDQFLLKKGPFAPQKITTESRLVGWLVDGRQRLVKQLDLTASQRWDQMAEKGTKKGPILASFDQKSIKGTNLLFPGPNWTHWNYAPRGQMSCLASGLPWSSK